MNPIIEIKTSRAPAPLPGASQALVGEGLIYVSGNIGLDKDTGKLVEGGIKAQTAQTLKNISGVLAKARSNFNRILKINVYLKSYTDYEAMNEEYVTHFGDMKPARTCVVVSGLPFEAIVQMDCIAMLREVQFSEIDPL